MSTVGQRERITQNRIVQFFQQELDYRYLGDWQDRPNNKNIEVDILTAWLKKRGVSDTLIARVIRQLDTAAALGEGKKLYYANKEVYQLLRYGVKDKEGAGELNQTVWLVDWKHPEANDFAIAEEVSIKGENKKRPDIVLYVNGIAIGVIELKRSSVGVSEGIRLNLDNQKKDFIRNGRHGRSHQSGACRCRLHKRKLSQGGDTFCRHCRQCGGSAGSRRRL